MKADVIQSPVRHAKLNLINLDNTSVEVDSPKLQSPNVNDSSTNRSSGTVLNLSAVHHLSPVHEFKRGLENEKHLSQFILHFDHLLSQPRGNRATDNAIAVLERSYKLQIEALLEETNQLKLDKKILEKKLDQANKGLTGSEAFGKNRFNKCQSDNCKMTLDAKDSTISELEFQVSQLRTENNLLKSAIEFLTNELDKMTQDINENGALRSKVEELKDEINLMQQKLQMEEVRGSKASQEIQQIKSENVTLKLRSQNNSFFDLNRMPSSRDQSMLSLSDFKGGRTISEWASQRNLRGLELVDSSSNNKDSTQLSPLNPMKSRTVSMFHHTRKESQDIFNGNTTLSKIVLSPGTSLKTLNDYERSILKEIEANPDSAAKLNARLVELRKIKAFYLEQENQKLMSLINTNRQSSQLNEDAGDGNAIDNKILDDVETYGGTTDREVKEVASG